MRELNARSMRRTQTVSVPQRAGPARPLGIGQRMAIHALRLPCSDDHPQRIGAARSALDQLATVFQVAIAVNVRLHRNDIMISYSQGGAWLNSS